MTRWLRAARGETASVQAGQGTERTEAPQPEVVSLCPEAPAPSNALADALEAAEERAAIREHDGGEDRETAEGHALGAHGPAILAAIRAGARYPGPISREADLPGVRWRGTVTYRLIDRLVSEGRLRWEAFGALGVVETDEGG